MKYILFLFFLIAPLYSMKRTDSGPLSFEDFAPDKFPPKKSRPYHEPRSAREYEAQWESWATCAREFDAMVLRLDGYVMFVHKELMCGQPGDQQLKRLHNRPDKNGPAAREMREKLAATYKIHLMPFDEDIVPIMRSLFLRLQQDINFRQALGYFKIAAETDRIAFPGGTMPIMVLYPHASKDAAQYVLNSVYDVLGNMQGKNIAPRYNERVTSLIHFAQGDGDYKHDHFAKYYEPNRVYYRSDFEGDSRNYHLVNPSIKN